MLLLEAFSYHRCSTLEKYQIALSLCLDLPKAFDMISNKILLGNIPVRGFQRSLRVPIFLYFRSFSLLTDTSS